MTGLGFGGFRGGLGVESVGSGVSEIRALSAIGWFRSGLTIQKMAAAAVAIKGISQKIVLRNFIERSSGAVLEKD